MSLRYIFPIPEEFVDHSKSFIFVGESGTGKTSLIFQCLKSVAMKERQTVLFIAPEKVTKMPLAVHGMPSLDPASAENLINVYLPTADDLIGFLATIHLQDVNPRLIAIDDFNVFMERRKNEKVNYIGYATKIFALLVDASCHFAESCSLCVSMNVKDSYPEERISITSVASYFFDRVYEITKEPSLERRSDFSIKCDNSKNVIYFFVENEQIFVDRVKEEKICFLRDAVNVQDT